MRANIIPIGASQPEKAQKQGHWSLFELAVPDSRPIPFGVLAFGDSGDFALRTRDEGEMADLTACDLSEQESDVLSLLADDLAVKVRESGPESVTAWFEDSLSHFLRISDRSALQYSGSIGEAADQLFEQHVDAEVRPFVTHLPFYGLRAAATKFGESMDAGEESWVRTPKSLSLSDDMFVVQVVGRSMEPLIPDGSLCVFRRFGAGSRQGKRLLIEKMGETDFASRYTVKRYTSTKSSGGADEWSHTRIRLEPLNPDFETFDLQGGEFESNYRAIAEFVEVLPS